MELAETRNCAVANPAPALVAAAFTKELIVKVFAVSTDTTLNIGPPNVELVKTILPPTVVAVVKYT